MRQPTLTRRGLGALAGAVLACPALAQTSGSSPAWPNRPVRWLIGYPPGGATDVVARLIANAIGPQLGQPVVVENRPGAAGIIAAEALSKSPPDGHTMMSVDMAVMVYNRALYRRLPYDPGRDLAPVTAYARFPFYLAVATKAMPQVRSVADFVARCKAEPGRVTMASVGVGSPHHLGIERLKRRAGIEVEHVPYRGGAAVMQDMMAGNVMAGFVDYASGAAGYQSGDTRPLAAATPARVAPFLDVPTLAEAGIPDCEVFSTHGAVMPAGTPPAILERMAALISDALASSDVARRYTELGAEATRLTPAEFRALVDREAAAWLPLIRELNISLDT